MTVCRKNESLRWSLSKSATRFSHVLARGWILGLSHGTSLEKSGVENSVIIPRVLWWNNTLWGMWLILESKDTGNLRQVLKQTSYRNQRASGNRRMCVSLATAIDLDSLQKQHKTLNAVYDYFTSKIQSSIKSSSTSPTSTPLPLPSRSSLLISVPTSGWPLTSKTSKSTSRWSSVISFLYLWAKAKKLWCHSNGSASATDLNLMK